jgi:hypothetical protein
MKLAIQHSSQPRIHDSDASSLKFRLPILPWTAAAPRRPVDEALLNRVTVTRLKALLSMQRFEIDTLDVATVKEKRIRDLDKEFQDLNRIVERSKSLDQR